MRTIKPRCASHNRPMRFMRGRWRCPTQFCPETSIEAPPKKWKKPKPLLTVYEDGREVLRGQAWMGRKAQVWLRDNGKCVGCGHDVTNPNGNLDRKAEIHHKRSRGMAGCYRDDRMENLETLCHDCHRKKTSI